MKATLEYYYMDKKIFWRGLTSKNTKVINSKSCDCCGYFERVLIETESYDELNKIVSELNETCMYGVSIVKTSDMIVGKKKLTKLERLKELRNNNLILCGKR